MSKKIIDWDELRAELLSDSEVQASFDAEERKERLREMLAQWRNHAGLTRAQVAERTNGIKNGSEYYPGKSRYINALCAGVRDKASADYALLTLNQLTEFTRFLLEVKLTILMR